MRDLFKWIARLQRKEEKDRDQRMWNSPMRELIGSVMVSSLLLPTFATLSLLYFQLPSTFLP